jgi:7-keto-8-aminopelargonate synthetase-like enzyme
VLGQPFGGYKNSFRGSILMDDSPTSHVVPHISPDADRSIAEAAAAGVLLQTVDDAPYAGRHIELRGSPLLNFGGCSYLGLESRYELREGAKRAIDRFGTQFSFSRAYLESALYPPLERALNAMTDGHALVTPSTTLGHIASIPVLVQPGDAVLIDRFAHASLHTATGLLRGVTIRPIRHSRVDLLEKAVAQLSESHRRVWYVLDGLYSMLGDFAPLGDIEKLRAKYPQLCLYIDDAHSTSWYGEHGRGYALEKLRDRRGVYVALSLNKAFSAGGGAIIFPNEEDRMRVRRGGGPLLFSGPVQPPLLGAALASAELHLEPSFRLLQQSLQGRIERAHGLAEAHGLSFSSQDRSPIFFMRFGPEKGTLALARAMQDRGIYVCVSVFPAVPHGLSGIRFTISLHNTASDIERLVDTIAAEMKRLGLSVMAEDAPGRAAHDAYESGLRAAVSPKHATATGNVEASPRSHLRPEPPTRPAVARRA